MIHVHQFPCLSDNYGYLVHDTESHETAAIDTPDATAYLREADQKGWRITQIWNTHWHADHAGGNARLKEATGAIVTGPGEVERIGAAPERIVDQGDVAMLGAVKARVLNVGGHTLGHIAYVFDEDRVAFVGDTIFALGCGRLFEGTPEQMWASFAKLTALPPETTLYCAHEYTQSNARFALHVEPDNDALKARSAEIDRLRAEGRATVPTSVSLELATNPFLRAGSAERFGALRRMKDSFQ